MSPALPHYLALGAVLFTIGMLGVLIRRNALIVFMSIELMLNAVNLSFMAVSWYLRSFQGQMMVFFVMAVAAAEVAVGLAIIVAFFRSRQTVMVDDLNTLKW